jgi:hypothetical protein
MSKTKPSDGIECGICYDELMTGEARLSLDRCGHVFHWECVKSWIDTMGDKVTCPLCRGALTRDNKTGPTIRWDRKTIARIRRDLAPYIDTTEAHRRTIGAMREARSKMVVPGMKRRLDTLVDAAQNETNPLGRACLLSQLSRADAPKSEAVNRFVKLARRGLELESKKERLRASTEKRARRVYNYELNELIRRLERYK